MMQKLPLIRRFRRTPEARFANLPDFPWTPRYVRIAEMRVACIDEGPRDAQVVLLMHGEPAWSFLYRKMIPVLLQAGYRVVAPDLIGFGRSDKPTRKSDYSYLNHVIWMHAWLEAMDLRHITLFCQDWGSLIGLRLAAHEPQRFDRIVLANGGLPTGRERLPRAFRIWRAFARYSPWFPIGRIVKAGCVHGLTPQEVAAYDAPFPTRKHALGARLFPSFVPTSTRDPESAANIRAWEVFKRWDKPFLTLFSNRDPITRGGHRIWHELVPGAKGQPHAVTRNAGHFLQEDKGPEVAAAIDLFIQATPVRQTPPA